SGDERLESGAGKTDGQDLVVFLRRNLGPMQRGNDRAVRERELPFAKRLYRNIVAQLSAQLFDLASCVFEVADGDYAPVAVSGRNRHAVDRRGVARGRWLTCRDILCRGFGDVESANGDDGANSDGRANSQDTNSLPGAV